MNTDFASQFREKLIGREAMIGTFVKTPSPILCEVLGLTAMDAVCLDAEHAPFGRLELDGCLFALRAASMPSLVRVQSSSPSEFLNALDCGASGVLVPHVCSAQQATDIAQQCRFGRGGRGYAGSTRAAEYTTKPMAAHRADSPGQTSVIVQIEDVEALDEIEAIAAVEGIDCLFVGRIDLTVALGAASPNDAIVLEAVDKICAAGKKFGKAVGMFVPSVDEVPAWQEKGASLFLLGSDHGFLLSGAKNLVDKFRAG